MYVNVRKIPEKETHVRRVPRRETYGLTQAPGSSNWNSLLGAYGGVYRWPPLTAPYFQDSQWMACDLIKMLLGCHYNVMLHPLFH